MKKMFKAFSVAFSVYSKIPMPRFNWESEDMEYCMIFFPFVGAVIGALEWGWYMLYQYTSMPDLLMIAISLVIPLLITGGIHIDGFMDTSDALSSYQPREKKLEILKDPHIGAFAVISLVIYMFTAAGFVATIDHEKAVAVICINFMLARALSGLGVITIQSAKNDGMLCTFATQAARRAVRYSLCIEIIALSGLVLWLEPVAGLLTIVCDWLMFAYYRYKSLKEFGGITGDLAGWFLSLAELFALIVVGGYCLWI